MALNFPPNPSIGDTYTVGSKTYRWSGSAWLVTSNNVTATNLLVVSGVNASSTNSGALQVQGGVGISQDLWIGGTIYSGSVPVLTTSSLGGQIFGGNDITVTSTGTTASTFLRFDNTSTLQTVTSRGNTTTNVVYIANITESTSTITGALVVTGGLGVGRRINCESIRIADSILDSTEIQVNSTASVVIDSFSRFDFRSAKYFIQVSSGGGPDHLIHGTSTFQAVELILVANNSSTVYSTEYGLVTSNPPARNGLFSADLSPIDNIVRLYFTASTATNTTVKVLRTSMAS